MPLVENTLQLPGKGPAVRAAVRARLIAKSSTEPASGFKASARIEVLGEWSTSSDAKGYWSIDLEGNALLTPSNSYYEIVEDPGPGAAPVVTHIIVPSTGGPHWIFDLRTTPPDALPTPDALTAHIANASDPHAAAGYKFRYVHDQMIASATWNVAHNLGGYPNVSSVDSAGTKVEADVQYVDENNVRLVFTSSTGGKAYLS